MELQEMMLELAEKKLEYKQDRKEFDEKHKHLKESIKSLENLIIDEVKKRKETVIVGNIKAEFVPTVKIMMKKEQENE